MGHRGIKTQPLPAGGMTAIRWIRDVYDSRPPRMSDWHATEAIKRTLCQRKVLIRHDTPETSTDLSKVTCSFCLRIMRKRGINP